MTTVVSRNGESTQQLLRRFKRRVLRDNVLGEVRKRRWFVPKSEQRRIAKKKAIRRSRRKKNTRSGYRR